MQCHSSWLLHIGTAGTATSNRPLQPESPAEHQRTTLLQLTPMNPTGHAGIYTGAAFSLVFSTTRRGLRGIILELQAWGRLCEEGWHGQWQT
eukprot:1157777-Pelagomonas_calceolata.AAC.10